MYLTKKWSKTSHPIKAAVLLGYYTTTIFHNGRVLMLTQYKPLPLEVQLTAYWGARNTVYI
jgi:hypothetical protein